MTEDQFEILIDKLDEIKRDLSSDLTTIQQSLDTISSRVGRIKDDASNFHLLQEVKVLIEAINKKID